MNLIDERRVHFRLPVISQIKFSFLQPYSLKKTLKNNKGILKNLSVDGLFFETKTLKKKKLDLLKNKKLFFSLEFTLPSSEKISTTAELRWIKDNTEYIETNKNGFGLKFLTMSVYTSKILEKYIKTAI